MQVGIFAKTFAGTDPLAVLSAARGAGYTVTQFNLACCGLPSMPDEVPAEVIAAIRAAAETTGVSLAALSGTYNMAHPDKRVREKGLGQLSVIIAAAAALSIPLVTLCTGTRNADDQWSHDPGNSEPGAWADMAAEMATALALAEEHGVDLGIEPEQANIVTSVDDAKRLIAEMGSRRLRIVLDPANLFERGTPSEVLDVVAHAVETSADHLAMAHAKDRYADGRFATVGRGIVDFPDFITRLKSVGFSGPLVTHGLSESEAPAIAVYLRGLI